MPNGTGVLIGGGNAMDNTIGGANPGTGNKIAFNGTGVVVGTNPSNISSGNTIRRNSIHDNQTWASTWVTTARRPTTW